MGLRWIGAIALVVLALGGVFVGQAATAGPGGWDHVGDGGTLRPNALNGNVTAMNADAPGQVLVGGDFTDAGGDARADGIASWNGVRWSPVGSASDQITGGVRAIAYANGKIYAGGTFTNAGGDANADSLAVWDGSTWKPFCDPVVPGHPTPGSVAALQVIGSTLYVGGAFQDWAGIADLNYIVACDLNSGMPSSTLPPGKFLNGSVYALAADSNGVLYAGGGFSDVDDIPQADKVAAFAGGSWSALGSGPSCVCGAITDFVRSLTTIGTDVYVGTDAKNVAGIAQADSVVRWDGSAWSAVGSSADGGDGWFPASTFIYAMTSLDAKLFVTGSFQNAGGDPTADNVAVFDGAAWHPVGSSGAGNGPWVGEGHGLVVFDRLAPATGPRTLYAGGSFTSAGGDTLANRVASFSLASITPVPTPTVTPAAPVATPTPMPQATPTPTPDTIRPKITALSLARTTFRAASSGGPFRAARAAIGTTVTFALSEPGNVRFTIDRSAAGRKVQGRCVKPSRSNRARSRCERWIAVKGSFTVAGRKGVNRIELRGRIGGRTLTPGRYRLNARETDPAANLSTTKRTAFTIVR